MGSSNSFFQLASRAPLSAARGSRCWGTVTQNPSSCSHGAHRSRPSLSPPVSPEPLLKEWASAACKCSSILGSRLGGWTPEENYFEDHCAHVICDRWGDDHAFRLTPAVLAQLLIAPSLSLPKVPWFGWENTEGGIIYNRWVPHLCWRGSWFAARELFQN